MPGADAIPAVFKAGDPTLIRKLTDLFANVGPGLIPQEFRVLSTTCISARVIVGIATTIEASPSSPSQRNIYLPESCSTVRQNT